VDREKVIGCAKHYVGDGGTTNGIDESNTVIDRDGMMRIHMPSYYSSISKGVATIMVSYSSWNGVKMHANHDLVTGFLKNTLQFQVNKLFIKYIIETQNCDICKISNN
jgi:beta-glucosidase